MNNPMARISAAFAGFVVVAGVLFAPCSLKAEAFPLSCVEEVGVPDDIGSLIAAQIPTSAEVTVTIGANGKAESAKYSAEGWLQFVLKKAFIEKGRYSASCQGKILTFKVRFEVSGEPTTYPESVTRFLPPNEFVVVCHPLKPIFN